LNALSLNSENASAMPPFFPTTIWGRASGPQSRLSFSFVTWTGVEKLRPASLELATEILPPAIQASHSLPSAAKAGVTFDAQRNTTSSHAASEAC
jgi:hypothetical protein